MAKRFGEGAFDAVQGGVGKALDTTNDTVGKALDAVSGGVQTTLDTVTKGLDSIFGLPSSTQESGSTEWECHCYPKR